MSSVLCIDDDDDALCLLLLHGDGGYLSLALQFSCLRLVYLVIYLTIFVIFDDILIPVLNLGF